MPPRISIGMPVFNGEKFINAAIESLLEQSYEDFEVIICDNASTDGTEDICRGYADRDSRIRYYRNQENLGAARNYNRVFELSTGEYFKWLAHDDVCSPDFLLRCREVLDNKTEVVLCGTKTQVINEQGEVTGFYDEIWGENSRCHVRFGETLADIPCAYPVFGLIRSSVLRRTSLIGSYISSDRVLLSELSLLGPFYTVREYLFSRRRVKAIGEVFATTEQRAVWFDPALEDTVILITSRLLREYLGAVGRTRINFSDAMICYWLLAKWAYRRKRALARDLLTYIKYLLGSI